MNRYVFIITAVCFSIYMFGCAKKQEPFEESQEPISMEQLGALKTQTAASETKAQVPESSVSFTQTSVPAAGTEIKMEPLPPTGPYKPTNMEIQAALKNAGFYKGKIDGIRGKMTEQAVKDFQNANGLDADGKVGPKTWAVLSQQLIVEPVLKKKSTLKAR